MNKIIILDPINEQVYVSDYDTAVYEDFGAFLVDFNQENNLKLEFNNCQWMEVEKVNINVL